jgi:hypothetical protein
LETAVQGEEGKGLAPDDLVAGADAEGGVHGLGGGA